MRYRLNDKPGDWNFAAGLEAELPAEDGPTAWNALFVAGREDRHGAWAGNLIASLEDGVDGPVHWSYRLGYSPASAGRIGYSVELAGGLEKDAAHEVLVGAGIQVNDNAFLKAGIGFGLTKDSPDFTLRAGTVIKLK